MFKRVENNINLADMENEISNYWDEIDAFQTSLNNRNNDKVFRFRKTCNNGKEPGV